MKEALEEALNNLNRSGWTFDEVLDVMDKVFEVTPEIFRKGDGLDLKFDTRPTNNPSGREVTYQSGGDFIILRNEEGPKQLQIRRTYIYLEKKYV